ncbi:hypothetical protein BJ508DRAFT_327627 [Ascobolus immersus RN42]|uniref:RBR-type E3 ubiquitin transferase n=1 Tax=Ascobolus immersus RN42 TaxID=1160509 RepID=A0A3N4I7I7_ASCIM|nr:hypothetical protein BJ508DRAFT_327627 [Ascobolus immersus RN42]
MYRAASAATLDFFGPQYPRQDDPSELDDLFYHPPHPDQLLNFDLTNTSSPQLVSPQSSRTSSVRNRPPTSRPEPASQPLPTSAPHTPRPGSMATAATAIDSDLQAWWTTQNLSFKFMLDTLTGVPMSLEYASELQEIQHCSKAGCNRRLEPGENHISTFYKRATEFTCDHAPPERLCEVCEVDAIYKVTRGEFSCGRDGCAGVLRVKEDVVKTVVGSKPEGENLVLEFLDLIDKNLPNCIVCDEKITPDTPRPTRNCPHDVNVCKGCMAGMVQSAIDGDDWNNIRCPELECRLVLDHEDVNKFADEELQSRYQELLAYSALEKMPEFMWCQRQGCNSGQLHPEGSPPKWICQKCRTTNCFNCKTEWHWSRSCAEMAEETLDTDDIKRRYYKRCPGKGCGIYIQKNGGCHEVACSNRMCRVNFCWECKVILDANVTYMTRGTKGHREGCEAPYVVTRRNDPGFEVVGMPDWRAEGSKYREGWDVDEGYVGTGGEYDT